MIKPIAIALIIGLVVGFGSGWTVNGWRHAKVKADLGICQQNTQVLEQAVRSQNERIEKLGEATAEARKTQEKALTKAQPHIDSLNQDIARISKLRLETCEEAENLIDKELGL